MAQIHVRLSDATHRRARVAAAEAGVSLSQFVADLLDLRLSGLAAPAQPAQVESAEDARRAHEAMVLDDARAAAQRAHLAELGDASLDEILARPYVPKEPDPWF